jgi:hypothetical protein
VILHHHVPRARVIPHPPRVVQFTTAAGFLKPCAMYSESHAASVIITTYPCPRFCRLLLPSSIPIL